ncbi:MAG: hypothetical protein HOD17_11880 [Desulfobacteraceae bacterium]|nr:hypothetical protein [Desulfobacteraceae bacterium]
MKKYPVIHLFLFGIYPALFLFTHNIGQIAPGALIIPLSIVIGFSLLFLLILNFFLKDVHKACVIVSLFLLLFFSYGHFSRYLVIVSALWGLIFFAGTWLTIKIKRDLKLVTYFLNIVASVLVGISLIQVGAYQFGTYQFKKEHASQMVRGGADKGEEKTESPQPLPNIFFIILDAYAREDVLRELYNYNNTEFLNFLEDKGFFVANQSMSNYCQTSLTVSSCLNMRYLNDLVGKYLPLESNTKQPLWGLIRRSRVFNFLKQRGYKIASFSSAIEETEIRNADIYIKPEWAWTLDGFQSELLNTTPVPVLLYLFRTTNLFDLHRERINHTLDHLPDLCSQPSPVFVFAHLGIPHPPFVFGPKGEKRDPNSKFDHHDGDWLIRKGRLSREQYKKAYVDQLVYTNKRVTEVIESILSRSENPPIILLFGDHGPRSMTKWEEPDNTYMKENLTILNAYYLPKRQQPSQLYDKITPVNSFRVIFNQYFDTDYEMLSDEAFFSTANYCYKFYMMTDRVRNPNTEIIQDYMGTDLVNQKKLKRPLHKISETGPEK